MGICNSLLQIRMYERTTKKCKYVAIAACAAVVCCFCVKINSLRNLHAFPSFINNKTEAGLPVYINSLL